MKSMAIIIPYFGKLPNYFTIFLESARKNSTIDFFVFTDNDIEIKKDDNIHIIKTTFDEIVKRAQNCFDFKISLNNYYKICDYKPVYGQMFFEYIKDYDFWGYCDIDIVLGDIRKFITDDILLKYDRVMTNGHFSLYRNCPKVNKWYCTLTAKGCQNYKDVYTNEKNCSYDEWAAHAGNGISEIIKRNNIPQFGERQEEKFYADLDILNYSFVFKICYGNFDKKDGIYFVYSNGKLYIRSKKDNSLNNEILYVHYQKRKIEVSSYNTNHFFLIPPGKIVSKESDVVFRNKFYGFKYKWLWRRLILKVKNIVDIKSKDNQR